MTLIFSPDAYVEVMNAWMAGLEKAAANGHDLSKIQSVASFFVSRVDSEVDKRLEAINTPRRPTCWDRPQSPTPVSPTASSRKSWSQTAGRPLEAQGAMPQRPLWASTGVKDPNYDDTRYVVDLVTRGVVNTMPGATMKAVADHGEITGDTIVAEIPAAQQIFVDLEAVGIDMADVFRVLEEEGVQKFIVAWEELLGTIEEALSSRGDNDA